MSVSINVNVIVIHDSQDEIVDCENCEDRVAHEIMLTADPLPKCLNCNGCCARRFTPWASYLDENMRQIH